MKLEKFERIIILLLLILCIPLFIYFFVLSFGFSWINVDLADEHVYKQVDFILGNIIGLFAITAIAYFAVVKRNVIEKLNIKRVAIIMGFVASLMAIYWVLNASVTPYTDQLACVDAASDINRGDYTTFEDGNYIARYHQQLGIVTILRVVFYLFGDGNYKAYQILSACTVFLIVYAVYRLAELLSDDNKIVEVISVFMIFLCLPVYFYTPFVYGEILGIGCMMMALVQFLELQKKLTVKRVLFLILCITVALMVRLYAIIMVIAMAGIVMVKLIVSPSKKRMVLILAALILGIACRLGITNTLYGEHLNNDTEAIPLIANIAMGTNNEAWHAGWYDGSSVRIFEENGCSAEASRRISKEIIHEFIETCKADPVYGVRFFLRKTGAQWAAPMYQSIVMNNNITDKQSALVETIYYSDTAWKVLDAYMNIFQLVVYSFVLLLLCKHKMTLEYYVGIITILGGFMWSVLGEAKTRYVFPYFIIMIPYAALGLCVVCNNIKEYKNKKTSGV